MNRDRQPIKLHAYGGGGAIRRQNVARKTKRVPTTETRELPVCVECDRALEQRDVESLVREPEVTLTERVKRVYTRYSSLSASGSDGEFEEVVGIEDSGRIVVCHYCLEEVYGYAHPAKRPLEEALEAADRIVDEVIKDDGEWES